uniref:Type I-A CRISPR-associated protein Cas4/Csa1 n=1 Tax=Thermofilum pendens TaxID=2269 RepID=A0A7C4FD57_THEPE
MPWLFPTVEEVSALLRDARRLPPVEVDEELRGWSYGEGALASTGQLVGVSDVASGFCDTHRDVYLRYVRRVPQRDNPVLQRGRLLHEAWTRTISAVKRILYASGGQLGAEKLSSELQRFPAPLAEQLASKYQQLEPGAVRWLVEKVVSEASFTYSAALEKQLSRSRYLELDGLVSAVVPLVTEFPINGERVGLSRSLRVDALILPSLLMELKTRHPRPAFEAGLAGYAIAFESEYAVPVDRALLLYLEVDTRSERLYVRPKLVALGNSLRSTFVEMRDKVKEILAYEEDPGASKNCPQECPYIHYCRGGSG